MSRHTACAIMLCIACYRVSSTSSSAISGSIFFTRSGTETRYKWCGRTKPTRAGDIVVVAGSQVLHMAKSNRRWVDVILTQQNPETARRTKDGQRKSQQRLVRDLRLSFSVFRSPCSFWVLLCKVLLKMYPRARKPFWLIDYFSVVTNFYFIISAGALLFTLPKPYPSYIKKAKLGMNNWSIFVISTLLLWVGSSYLGETVSTCCTLSALPHAQIIFDQFRQVKSLLSLHSVLHQMAFQVVCPQIYAGAIGFIENRERCYKYHIETVLCRMRVCRLFYIRLFGSPCDSAFYFTPYI